MDESNVDFFLFPPRILPISNIVHRVAVQVNQFSHIINKNYINLKSNLHICNLFKTNNRTVSL